MSSTTDTQSAPEEWNFIPEIQNAFKTFCQTSTNISDEFTNILKGILAPDYLSYTNQLKVKLEQEGTMIYTISYRDGNSDMRKGSRFSRNITVVFLRETQKMYLLRQGLLHSVEGRTSRQFTKGLETNDGDPEKSRLAIDNTLKSSLAWIKEINNYDLQDPDQVYLMAKHDGSTMTVTMIHPDHPTFEVVKKFLRNESSGLGSLILNDFITNYRPYLLIPGTSGSFITSDPGMQSYLGTSILCQYGKYSKDYYLGTLSLSPSELLFHALVETQFSIMKKVIDSAFSRNLCNDCHSNTFTLFYEACCPDLTDWHNLRCHTELTAVYPKGGAYLLGFGCSVPNPHDKTEEIRGTYYPINVVHDLLRNHNIQMPITFEIPVDQPGLVDEMVQDMESHLRSPMPYDMLDENLEHFTNEFLRKFDDYNMDPFTKKIGVTGFDMVFIAISMYYFPMFYMIQLMVLFMMFWNNFGIISLFQYFKNKVVHCRKDVISFEGFCVFFRYGDRWDYLKVKLDDYYPAHKHAMDHLDTVIDSHHNKHFRTQIFGSYSMMLKIHFEIADHPGKLFDDVKTYLDSCNLCDFDQLIQKRLEFVPDGKRSKIQNNLSNDSYCNKKVAFWGTLLGDRNMIPIVFEFLSPTVTPHITLMGILEFFDSDHEKYSKSEYAELRNSFQHAVHTIAMSICRGDSEKKLDELKKLLHDRSTSIKTMMW